MATIYYTYFQCFSQKILFEGQSGHRRLVLETNILGKGPIDNKCVKNSLQMQMYDR